MKPDDATTLLLEADAAFQGMRPLPFPVPLGPLCPLMAGCLTALTDDDWWFPSLRDRVAATLRGVALERLLDPSQGVDTHRVAPADPTSARRALLGVGAAMTGEDHRVLVTLGLGALGDGDFHAALSLGGQQSAPVTFVIACPTIQDDAPISNQSASDLPALAAAHGWATHTIDGTSAKAAHNAVRAAGKAGGPHLIIAQLTP